MELLDLVRRESHAAGGWLKIPWNDPAFSRRMLAEHLSQSHDGASRRFDTIDRHVEWIHADLLRGRPSRVLDLGCGPGLYANRLAQRGHSCTGIDFSPASIMYARERAADMHLPAVFQQADIRTAEYGSGYDLVMLIYGEFNAFARSDAAAIVSKTRAALANGGTLLLELSTFDSLRQRGERPPSWFTAERGLFSDMPYLCLKESDWDAVRAIATERYFVIDPTNASVTPYAVMTQAYQESDYRQLLSECGFFGVERHPAFGDITSADFLVFTAA
ncbi:MAG: class I SAM-dependent methyltransferase [Chloroflexi bacterium]|nr:class I SAM-dependent methyltransferase [Chloroflexota bacterium]